MFTEQDKKDADVINQWLQKNHVHPQASLEHIREMAPRVIMSAIERLIYSHLRITAFDLYDVCKKAVRPNA